LSARRTRKFAVIALALVRLVLDLTAYAPNVRAADDIQQVKLGPHTFYVPKSWMQGGAITAYAPPQTMVQQPQPDAIHATALSIRPREDWKPYGRRDLPELIRVGYAEGVVPLPPLLGMQRKQLLDEASSMKADGDGFVRVGVGSSEPGKQLASETFLYKGYLNNLGEPLVVLSNNTETPFGHHYPSSVTISPQADLGLQYRFDNKEFPENTWWPLYQRVLAFLDYLQTPK
jgi:hypothetical protein